MILRPRFIVRATLSLALFAVVACIDPEPARAIQLRWSTGTTDLTVSQDTQAVLVVQADSAEVTLPNTWRLQWTADTSLVEFSAFDPSYACLVDTAKVDSIAPPSTPADSAANQVTAWFCSSGSDNAASAYFLVDLPGGGHGKMIAVALNPVDTTQVIESNEVTFNGGVEGSYSPALLSAARTHDSSRLIITALGAGLDTASVVQIAARDTTWRLALSVTRHSRTELTATAQVAADLPPFVLRVAGSSPGGEGVAVLPADEPSTLVVQPACTNEIKEINQYTHENIQPKDFTIIASRDSFHVFYTRQDYNLSGQPELDSRVIGHKRSRDLNTWDPPDHTYEALVARTGKWDNGHVWAPTIVKKPDDITYYLIYTGVDSLGVQRIGVATSTDLNVWHQDDAPAYQTSDVGWALTGTNDFRDPFVMLDPDSTHYLLYFVTQTQARKRFVVGVARTTDTDPGNLRSWTNPQPLWNTDKVHTGQSFIESPHVFADPWKRWWLYYTGYNTQSDPAYVSFETNDASPVADSTQWSAPDTLFEYFGGDQKLAFWHASEYYKWEPGYEYLMAFNDSEHSISISQISWHETGHTFALTDSCPPKSALGVPPESGATSLSLSLLGRRPSTAPAVLNVHAPAGMRTHVGVFDVSGRCLRVLWDGTILAGEKLIPWDGRDRDGQPLGAGVYYVSLTTATGRRTAKLILLR